MTHKVLLDTDIGSDVNDAICLAYLLAQPDCDLLGITTVTGEAVLRARLASVLCKVAEKEVPIYPGQEEPLYVRQRQTSAPQARILSSWAHDVDFPEDQAVQFLRQTIHDHPGAITLLTTGPLTNIALLFAVDPHIPGLLKQIVFMGGRYATDLPEMASLEWNALCDPFSLAKVLTSPVPVRAVGLETTSQVQIESRIVQERFWAPLLRPVLDLGEGRLQEREMITFHDAVAAATIFDDGICRFESGAIEVELEADQLRGLTRWTPGAQPVGAGEGDAQPAHAVAVDVRAERFFNHFFGLF